MTQIIENTISQRNIALNIAKNSTFDVINVKMYKTQFRTVT